MRPIWCSPVVKQGFPAVIFVCCEHFLQVKLKIFLWSSNRISAMYIWSTPSWYTLKQSFKSDSFEITLYFERSKSTPTNAIKITIYRRFLVSFLRYFEHKMTLIGLENSVINQLLITCCDYPSCSLFMWSQETR